MKFFFIFHADFAESCRHFNQVPGLQLRAIDASMKKNGLGELPI